MTDNEARSLKDEVLHKLRSAMYEYTSIIAKIDTRLLDYAAYIIDTRHDRANLYELLGFVKFLRMLTTYEYDYERVKKYIRVLEGEWEGTHYVRGGLMFDGRHVRLMPYQVYCIANIYGFLHEVDTGLTSGDRELFPTERISKNHIIDKRRIIIEAHIFQTRKSGKTAFGAALDLLDFMFGPENGEVLICANSQAQAKIAFKAVKQFALQLDPDGRYLRITSDEINWKDGQRRTNSIKAMSAGGKTKDGLFGSIIHADEHGSASYVKDHSDMQALVDVCWGSRGPRREPLLLHTTTAGNVTEGPYELQLRKVEELLLCEADLPLDIGVHATDNDWWFALLLQPDQWERTGSIDDLDNEDIFCKVNHSIGITVQSDYYKSRIREARTKGDDTLKEVLTKDFNIWRASRATVWLRADEIRRLQIDRRIDDITSDDGWVCFVGMDFARCNDLNAQSYLCYNRETKEFFADMDAWVSEETLETNANGHLYKMLADKGWLHVSAGKVIDDTLITRRLMEIAEHLDILRMGYDDYDAKRFVTDISMWIYSEGQDPKAYLRPVSQGWAAYNSPVQEMEYMVKSEPPLIHFSKNPMWPWQFENCMLELDRMDNAKPVKSGANKKVDNVQALLSALILYDEAMGTVEK